MRTIFLIATIFISFRELSAQLTKTYNIDSLKQILSTAGEDTNRVWALNNLGRNIQNSDTTIILAEQAIALSQKLGFKPGEAEAYNNIGYWFEKWISQKLVEKNKKIKLAAAKKIIATMDREENKIGIDIV